MKTSYRYLRIWKNLLSALVLLCLILSGCAYNSNINVNTLLPSYIQKIYIPIFENKTIQYGLEEKITNLVMEEFLKGERLEIGSKEDTSDMVLKGSLILYQRTPLSYNENSRVTRYKIYIEIIFSFYDLINKQLLFQKQISETVTYLPEESEDVAIEKALGNLAHYMANSIRQSF